MNKRTCSDLESGSEYLPHTAVSAIIETNIGGITNGQNSQYCTNHRPSPRCNSHCKARNQAARTIYYHTKGACCCCNGQHRGIEHSRHELELLRLLAQGEKEIEAGKGYDLDVVLSEADNLLRELKDRKSTRLNSSHSQI